MFQLTKNIIRVRCLLNKNLEKLIKKTQKNKNEQNDFELAYNFCQKKKSEERRIKRKDEKNSLH